MFNMSEEDAVKFCTNCKRDIPQANYVMHSMHCQRNLALCTKCDEPVPLIELASHNAKYHVSVECPACHISIERSKLSEHEKSSCKRRAICCNYCHIETEATELQEHENYCGSRTEKCDECGEYVMLKYTQLHLDSNHGFLKLDEEPGPTPSWDKPRASTGLQNDLSRRRKVLNASQYPVRSSLPSTNADVFTRPTVSQITKPDASARLLRWNDSDNLVLSQSRQDFLRSNSSRISQDPVRVLPSRSTRDPIQENLSRNSPDLIRGSRIATDPVRTGAVRNPVQESVRPSAAGNRLSPSKRTNDMPQVNSAAAVDIPKALHKPVIRQSESDRLMAGLGTAGIDRNPYALAKNMLENLDLDHDMGGGDIVALPCEFCDAMIPANQLVIHETGCRPDLACYKNQMHPDVLGDNGLPCEFCGGLYPPHNLLSHQAHCEVPTRGDVLVNAFDVQAVKEVNVIKQKQSNLSEEERYRPQQQPLRPLPNISVPLMRGSDESWKKPTANVNPIGGIRQLMSQPPSVALNGHQRHPMSTGAVPKQKAGTRPGLREVQQEVPRPSSSAPITPRNFEPHHR